MPSIIFNGARLLPHALAAPQMTSIVIGDARFDTSLWLFSGMEARYFTYIPDLAAELMRALGPLGIICKQPAIFLEGRTAGCAICYDNLHLCLFKESNVMLSLFQDQILTPVTRRRHPTANGFLWRDDGASIRPVTRTVTTPCSANVRLWAQPRKKPTRTSPRPSPFRRGKQDRFGFFRQNSSQWTLR